MSKVRGRDTGIGELCWERVGCVLASGYVPVTWKDIEGRRKMDQDVPVIRLEEEGSGYTGNKAGGRMNGMY